MARTSSVLMSPSEPRHQPKRGPFPSGVTPAGTALRRRAGRLGDRRLALAMPGPCLHPRPCDLAAAATRIHERARRHLGDAQQRLALRRASTTSAVCSRSPTSHESSATHSLSSSSSRSSAWWEGSSWRWRSHRRRVAHPFCLGSWSSSGRFRRWSTDRSGSSCSAITG